MKKLHLIVVVAAFAMVVAPFFLVLATTTPATATISPYIPGAGTVPTSGSPGAWLANVYDYAFFLGGILAFGAIAYGGIRYALSAGNPSGLKDAREWVQSALLGLLLLAAAYLILYTVNPAIVNLSFDVPALVTPAPLGGGGSSGGGGGGGGGPGTGGVCTAPTAGPCANAATFQNTCFANNAVVAAAVCNGESSGNANAQGDFCDDGNPASIGLFQINLSANTMPDPQHPGQTLRCNTAFDKAFNGAHHCGAVVNRTLYDQCVAAAKDPKTNIQQACNLYTASNNTFALWSTPAKNCTAPVVQ